MAEACRALGLPVVGGNVSLYNETRGHDIDPTPIVGVLGIVDRLERRPAGVRLEPGGELLLLGDDPDPAAGLAGSRWAWSHGARGGRLLAFDAARHQAVAEVVRALVADDVVTGVHDVADGGLGLTLAELAVQSGFGLVAGGVGGLAGLFSESPSRVVVCVARDRVAEVAGRCDDAGVPWSRLGQAGGDRLVVEGLVDLALDEAVTAWRQRLPNAFGVAAAH
jgi:phosphoribosylformylglycinamidine (FGAM) synthase-like enzyme